MKRLNRLIALALALLAFAALPAMAETTITGTAAAETVAASDAEAVTLMDQYTATTDMTRLDLGSVKATDLQRLEAFLDKFPKLERVDMFATPLRNSQVEELAARYPDVKFGWTVQIAEHTFRTDQTAFSTLHYGGAKTHNNKMFTALRFCTELRALDLGHNGFNDLSFLYEMPELRVLIIACNHFTDLTPIASLKKLEYLEIFSNDITDISPLAGLPNLMDLNIGYNKITDYSPLFELPSLKRLWMYKSNAYGVAAPVDELQAAYPDCLINNVSNPSEGGWRQHPHFDVIHAMFRANVYQPFEDSFTDE